jgi:hypothetical protein
MVPAEQEPDDAAVPLTDDCAGGWKPTTAEDIFQMDAVNRASEILGDIALFAQLINRPIETVRASSTGQAPVPLDSYVDAVTIISAALERQTQPARGRTAKPLSVS